MTTRMRGWWGSSRAGVSRRPTNTQVVAVLAALLGGFGVAACSSGDIAPALPNIGLACVDDSPRCIAERGNVLKGLMADRSKTWVRTPASPAAYASGVRLWAFKQKKRELSCDELILARREADGAAPSLRGSSAGLTPAQISRGIMLAQDVSKELGNEYGRRCRV
jgi:hypothetical protein